MTGSLEGPHALPAHVAVAIVGSGFAGLATAIGLKRAGREDFVVLERAHDLGGTWRDNSYPGCACDVPSHLYSYSFAPNPQWSRTFSRQPEIEAYLHRTALEAGVLPHLRFGAELEHAAWDGRRWHLVTARGALTADVLVSATGGLSEPALPSLPGLETFAGTSFHSAAWDHAHDLRGRRVAVVGTGASAVQFVPEIQPQVEHLTVFQRTAPWVLPRRDRAITDLERTLFRRVPVAQRLARLGTYWLRESWILGFAVDQRVMALGEFEARRHLRAQVPDAVRRAALTPAYRLGCKRVLLSNTYYPAVSAPNARVVTTGIREVVPRGVVTEDGSLHEVDTMIFGTGFMVTDPPVAHRLVGADDRTLAQHWAERGMQALHGLTVSGFPNLFFLVGPNTGLGHTSIIVVIEAQVQHLLAALDAMDARGLASIEPLAEAEAAYNARVQQDLQGTVWNAGGCSSWYLDAKGRNTRLWPTFTFRFSRQLSEFDLGLYRTAAA